MKKLLLAAVLMLGLVGSVHGATTYTLLDTGILPVAGADSSAVINVSGYDLMTLEFMVTPGGVDSMVVLYVSAYEVLPKYYTNDAARAIVDSLMSWGLYRGDSAGVFSAPAVNDSNVVHWLPNLAVRQTSAASAAADTIAYNSLDGTTSLPASNEIRLRFPRAASGALPSRKMISVPLVNTLGVPFHAQWAYFKWRRPATLSGGATRPLVRVLLKGVRY